MTSQNVCVSSLKLILPEGFFSSPGLLVFLWVINQAILCASSMFKISFSALLKSFFTKSKWCQQYNYMKLEKHLLGTHMFARSFNNLNSTHIIITKQRSLIMQHWHLLSGSPTFANVRLLCGIIYSVLCYIQSAVIFDSGHRNVFAARSCEILQGRFGVFDLRFFSESCLPPVAPASLYHSSPEYFMSFSFPFSIHSHCFATRISWKSHLVSLFKA